MDVEEEMVSISNSVVQRHIRMAVFGDLEMKKKFCSLEDDSKLIQEALNRTEGGDRTMYTKTRTDDPCAENIIEEFHKLFYGQGMLRLNIAGEEVVLQNKNTAYYKGIETQKNPLDLWVFQEIVWETKPDLIVEFGTAAGGTTYFLADLLEGTDRILSVDIVDRRATLQKNGRITYLGGDTLDENIQMVIRDVAGYYHRRMLILDDDHSKEHVLEELKRYSWLVTPGQYLIVEDTNISGHPVGEKNGNGPMEAVEEFLATEQGKKFEVDRSREKFLCTFNPGGYLRRVR
jgi:cephalosporin hydroxylase